MRGLYAIVDLATLDQHKLDPAHFCRELLGVPLAAVQLRAKQASAGRVVSVARELAGWCRGAGEAAGGPVPFFVNDRADIAVLAGATGVHVGQTDPSVADIRRVAPGLRVGVSTHTPAQLESALRLEPDYVAYGPVFPTQSKAEPETCVGLEGLRGACARARAAGVPLVGIGGIGSHNARAVAPWVDAVAVIGALVSPQEESTPRARAARIAGSLRG